MKYLYNGHIAPELPSYSQAEFPYALIASANEDNTALILMLCVNRPYYGTNPEDSSKKGVYNTGRMQVYTCTDTDEAWIFSMETENPLTANEDDPGGGVIWTRKNILKTNGRIWMAWSEPVPMGVSENWLRCFKEGLALGLTGASLPYTGDYTGKEPIGFLYGRVAKDGETPTHTINGVGYVGAVLPKVPEWDKKKYPHAYIRYVDDPNYYRFFAFTKRPYANTVYSLLQVRHHGDYFYTCVGEYIGSTEHWREPSENSYNIQYAEPSDAIYVWADFDIINEDDESIYFAKCPAPVAVYE